MISADGRALLLLFDRYCTPGHSIGSGVTAQALHSTQALHSILTRFPGGFDYCPKFVTTPPDVLATLE